MRVVKVLLFILVGLVALLVVLAVALPGIVHMERYRSMLASRVGKALGREVALGDLRLSLLPQPGAEVRGIRIAEQPGFGAGTFLEAEGLSVRVGLLPLLRGQVKVSRATLERPRIVVARDRRGHWTFEDLLHAGGPAGPPGRPSPDAARGARGGFAAGLLVAEVQVRRGEITIRDAAASGKGASLQLGDVDLRASQEAPTAPVTLRARAALPGSPPGELDLTGTVTLGEVEGVLLDLALRVRDLDLAELRPYLLARDSSVRIGGRAGAQAKATGPPARLDFEGEVDLGKASIEAGTGWRKAVDEEARVAFAGRGTGDVIDLTRVVLALRGARLEGRARITDLSAPRITFALAAPRLEVGDLLGPPAAAGGARGERGRGPMGVAWALPPPPAAASAPRPTSPGATPVVAEGRLSVDDLRWGRLALTQVRADVRYRDGILRLPDVQGRLYGGTIVAASEIDLRGSVPRVGLTSHLEGVQTEHLLQALAAPSWSLRGALTLDAELAFAARQAADLVGSTTGGGNFVVRDGRLDGYKPLERLAEVAGPVLAGAGGRPPRLNEFRSLTGHFTIDKGFLRTRDLLLQKEEGQVTGAGAWGLLDSSLDFDVAARIGRVGLEAKVSGTTAEPLVVPKLGKVQRRLETEIEKGLQRLLRPRP